MEAARTILPVALTLALGMLCRKKELISRSGVDALKTVAVQIGLPAVLLYSFAVMRYSAATPVVPLIMFLPPPPFVLPVFAGEGDQRAFVSSVLSVSTLVTVAGFVALAASGV